MSDDQFKPTGSPAFPRQPTSRMIEVGAIAGGVGPKVAERIYIAMLRMV
jgi:hypothetical protein